jgi:cytochrome P450
VARFAYLPFGAGSPSCIGEQFAWTEVVSVLAVLAGTWRFESVSGHVVTPQYRITLPPDGGLPMIAAAW